MVYPVNALSFHPTYGTFSTAGADGYIHMWDKDSRQRLESSVSSALQFKLQLSIVMDPFRLFPRLRLVQGTRVLWG